MKNTLHTPILATLAATLALTPSLVDAACLSGGEIQQAVASGQILPLNQIMQSAAPGAKPVSPPAPTVCERGGELHWEIVVLYPDGRTENLALNATTGQP